MTTRWQELAAAYAASVRHREEAAAPERDDVAGRAGDRPVLDDPTGGGA